MTDNKAIQQKLNDLGASPPLVVDGNFGPKSKAALVAFQRSHGLKPDGIVGPKTLAALGMGELAKGDPNDVTAYNVAKRAAPTMPEAQRQYVLAVARGEGRFGLGWSVPPADPTALAFAKSKGLTGLEGVGSNNWGAEQGSGDAGSFPHVDFGWRNPDGSPWNGSGPKVWLPYVGKYKRWSSPEKGFLSVANAVLNGLKRGAVGAKEIQDAIARGDLKAAVDAQHANGYFELGPAQYLAAVERNYEAMTSSTGWSRLFGAQGLGSIFAAVAGATAVTAALWWWWHKGKGVAV